MAHAHSHGHGHGEGHSHSATSRKLVISTILTFGFVLVELAVGVVSNSLALIGDAFHNFTDGLALILALWALWAERRPPTAEKSFGYQRAGVLAAFINAGTLVGLTLYLLVEAYHRLRNPEPVGSASMLVTAGAGLLVNGFITWWLYEEGKHDINVRGAVTHMLGDAVSTVGIIIAAIAIRITGIAAIDPAITVLIAGIVLWSSWGILREAVNLLLEGTPRGIDPEAVSRDLASLEGVFGVHHLHIWALGPSRPALSCHLMLGDITLKSGGAVIQRATDLLAERYRISHTTIQIEYAGCEIDDPFCSPEEARKRLHG